MNTAVTSPDYTTGTSVIDLAVALVVTLGVPLSLWTYVFQQISIISI